METRIVMYKSPQLVQRNPDNFELEFDAEIVLFNKHILYSLAEVNI